MIARDKLAPQRGELQDLVGDAAERDDDDWYREAANAILAAGYQKPRTITTAEELDALADGSAVLDTDHDVSTKHEGKWHGYEMNPLDSRKFKNYGPFTVLWEPEASK